MQPKLTFDEVCRFIKEDDPKLTDNVDAALGFILIISPLVFLPSTALVAPALGLLGVKNELTKLGKFLYEKITAKKDKNNVAKMRRMEIAYGLICYTAFFEAADALLGSIKRSPSLGSKEKYTLSKEALSRFNKRYGKNEAEEENLDSGLQNLLIPMPNPLESFDSHCEKLFSLYQELSQGLLSFVEGLAFWKDLDNSERWRVQSFLNEQLPESSMEYFKAQYFQLAAKYEDFYVWSNLKEHRETRGQIKEMSEYLKRHIALAEAGKGSFDVGFVKLSKVISAIPKQVEALKANKVLEELNKTYKGLVNLPIIEEQETTDSDDPALIFPKNFEIFIPQSFKLIRYTEKERLEDEGTWKEVESRDDLGAFLLSYLSSPHSAYAPLVILGHPGSGKSLLTKILASRFISPLYIPFLVKLRDIEADDEITLQIEEQIRKDAREASWASLSDHLIEKFPLILLDGYDELLQASGKVFSGYLMKVQKFQEREMTVRQPVRCIVTSRITLIDKAQIPKDSVIIRLEEFDDEKRKKWISIWNSTNSQYFSRKQIKPLHLPPNNEKVTTLASQPLLLLMLALYDSDRNQLHSHSNLDQTALYFSLIHRFVERERMKAEEFQALSEKERKAEIDREIERLGVAAIGMFNRRSLHIKSTQLNNDLAFFQLEKEGQETGGRRLSQADIVLGSFFFIYQSKSTYKSDVHQEREIESAFEFLHNTFGEFLTAEFMLRKILAETQSLSKLRKDEDLKVELDRKLNDPNGFSPSWFVSLMNTPLFTRPVVLEMLREWTKHKLLSINRKHEDFLNDFDAIISNQITRLLNSNTFPSIMTESNKTSFNDHPLIANLAIYTINLIIIRTVLSGGSYIFDERAISQNEEGVRPWDRLSHLWRTWFSVENLNGLTAILTAERKGDNILIQCKETFGIPSSGNRLNSILNISLSIADDIIASLGGLLIYDPFIHGNLSLPDIQAKLKSENLKLNSEVVLRYLRSTFGNVLTYEEQSELFEQCLSLLRETPKSDFGAFIELLLLMENIGNRKYFSKFTEEFFGQIDLVSLIKSSPYSVLALFRMIDNETLVSEGYSTDFFNYIINSQYLMEVPSRLVAETIRLARQTAGESLPFDSLARYFEDLCNKRLKGIAPEIAVELIYVSSELEDKSLFEKLSKTFLDDFVNPQMLREASPDMLIKILTLAHQNKDPKYFIRYANKFLLGMTQEYLLRMTPDVAAEAFRLALEVHDRGASRHFFEVFPVYISNSKYWKYLSAEEHETFIRLFDEVRDPMLRERLS
jgi:hypothetical protein